MKEMIESTVIDGRKATVAYIHRDFTSADRDTAEMVKILFDNGVVRFAVRAEKEKQL